MTNDTLTQWEKDIELEASFHPGLASPLVLNYRSKLLALIDLIRKKDEAMKIGAFHHSICAANYYDDKSMKPNWDGIGEHRLAQPCTCSKKYVDEALALTERLNDLR